MIDNFKFSFFDCNRQHLTKLIQLGGSYYKKNSNNLNPKYLEWLYLANPYGPAKLVVAEQGGEWVGVIVLIPIELEQASLSQHAYYAVNVLTHPAFRGRNLFSLMIEKAIQNLAAAGCWLLGHPNANALNGWKKHNMEFREPLLVHMRKIWPLKLWNGTKTSITTLAQLQALGEDFWNKLSERQELHVKYTPELLHWKFLSAANQQYKVQVVKELDKVLGLLVTRKYKAMLDLLIDVICPVADVEKVLSQVKLGTLIMHSHSGLLKDKIEQVCWKLPVNKMMPVFVSTWASEKKLDCSGIFLTASDF